MTVGPKWTAALVVVASIMLLAVLHRLELLLIVFPLSAAASYLAGKRRIRAGKL
jgi:hypothetical protein